MYEKISENIKRFYSSRFGPQLSFLFTFLIWVLVVTVVIEMNMLPRIWESGSGYDIIAKNISEKGIYSLNGETFTTFRPPMYPLILAGVMEVFSEGWRIATIYIQVTVGSICSFFIYKIAYKLFGDEIISIFSVLLFTANPLFLGEILNIRETIIFSFLIVSFLYFLLRPCKSYVNVLTMSLCAGVSQLVRPTGIILIATMVLYLFKSRLEAKKILLSIFTLAIIVMPWYGLMYVQKGYVGISPSTTGGLNLYKGNNRITENTYPWVDVDAQQSILKRKFKNLNTLHSTYADKYLKAKAFKYITSNPAEFLEMSVLKVLSLYSPIIVPIGNGDIKKYKGEFVVDNFKAPDRNPLVVLLSSIYTLVIIAGLCGYIILCICGFCKSEADGAIYLCVIIAFLTLIHSITFSETRFRVPIDPLIAVLSSYFFLYCIKNNILNK